MDQALIGEVLAPIPCAGRGVSPSASDLFGVTFHQTRSQMQPVHAPPSCTGAPNGDRESLHKFPFNLSLAECF